MSKGGTIELSELWQPAFNSVWNEISAFVIGRANRGDMPPSKYDELFLQGGRASGKSTLAATIIWLALENDPQKNAVIIRKVGSSLRKSCWKQMMKIRDKLEYWHWEPNKTEMVFTNKFTGQQIFFVGLDDEEKVRSITTEKGYISIAWFEEAKQFKNIEEIDQAVASLLRGGADNDERDYDNEEEGSQEYMSILTYNPPKSGYEWINREARRPKKNRLTHKSTYLTMPKKWLGKKILAEIEAMKERDPKQYRHMYLGEITGVEQQFFNNITTRKITDEEIKSFKWMDFGIDWGDIDPNVWGAFYLNDGKLYIFDEIYQEGKSKNKIFDFAQMVLEKMRKWGVDEPIWADAQGKAQCQVLNSDKYKLNVKDFTPKQGKNGRTEGGNFLKSLVEIIIDPERCPHFSEQFALFEHKEAPGGNGFLDEPATFGDHCFSGDTIIHTKKGDFRIDQLVGTNGKLLAYDEATGKFVWKTYHDCRKTFERASVIRIETEDGKFVECTPDHKILTKDGWKEAQYLCEDDYIICLCHRQMSILKFLEAKRIHGKRPVYDVAVDDVHNLVVNNGIVAHNCFDCTRYGLNKWIAKADFNNEVPMDEWSSLSEVLNTPDDEVDILDYEPDGDLTDSEDMW